MKFYGKTDVGKRRTENQDCFGIYEILTDVNLLVVCDGMGGAAGGSIASQTARDTFAQSVREHLIPDCPDDAPALNSSNLRFAISAGITDANSAVWDMAKNSKGGKLDGMGTTLAAVLVVEGKLAFTVNVGDSRIYEITNNEITQLTVDHSYIQYLIDLGQLTYEEAKYSPMRNVITRAVGIDDDIRADISPLDPTPGTEDAPRTILICSDGLHGSLEDDEIAKIVRSDESLQKKAELLTAAANAAGGPDNITVVLTEL